MGFANKIHTSIHGRDIGIQSLSSAESGSGRGVAKFLAGFVADIRKEVSTAETTSANLKAHGLSHLGTTSTGNGTVYTLDPPIPGITKLIALTCGASDGPVYVKTANSETVESTAGSSFTVFRLSTRGLVELVGITTSRWLTAMSSASFNLFSTST